MPGSHQRDHLDAGVRWQHEFSGRPGRVYTDTFNGFRRGKPSWTTDETGTETTIRIEWPRARVKPEREQGVGASIDNDAVIILDPDDVDVSDGRDGETDRASIIEDVSSGDRYRVVRLRDEGSPLIYADCEDLDPDAGPDTSGETNG